MAQISLKDFASIARTASDNATIRVDLQTGGLKVNHNRFRRAVRWFRKRLGLSGESRSIRGRHSAGALSEEMMRSRDAESSAAHNAFIRAIAHDFYTQKDIDDKVWPLMASDQTLSELSRPYAEKGLPARVVKEVFSHLNQEACATRREISKAAHYVAGRRDAAGNKVGDYLSKTLYATIHQRSRLREFGYVMKKEDEQALGERIFEEVMKKAENGSDEELKKLTGRGATMIEAQRIADRLIEEALDKEEDRLFGVPERGAEVPAGEGAAPADAREIPKHISEPLSQHLKKLKIPDRENLEQRLQEHKADPSVAHGEKETAQVVNQHTLGWVSEQRMQRWYEAMLPDKKAGNTQIPQQLQQQIKDSILAHEQIVPYEDIKAQTRAIIREYVEKNIPSSLPAQLSEARLPADVAGHIGGLIADGTITDRGSLAAHGNRALAEWVTDHRVGKWYREALAAEGIGFKGTQIIPQKLYGDVTQAIVDKPGLWSYPLLKAQARQIARDYAEEEVYGTRV